MPIKILMPALSPTMTEGNLVKWHKKEGDTVKAGQVLAEIETDKATMEVEAVDEGTVGRILVLEGAQNVKVNEIIALLLEEGEGPSSLDKVEVSAKIAVPAAAAPSAEVVEMPKAIPAKVEAAPKVLPQAAAAQGRVFATPLARRIAEQQGIDLTCIQGSGPRGRIIKADVEGGAPMRGAPSSPHLMRGSVQPYVVDEFGFPAYDTVAVNTMRKVIAQRLTESKQNVPHFYLTIECEIDALLDVRKQINTMEGAKVTVNDLIIRACALALRDVPAANASWMNDHIRQYHSQDVAVAVAIEGGLITPIIRDAGQKKILEISQESKALVEKARAGKLKPQEYQGGTFSLSNLGMFGIKNFGAIINPPQGCILAVGAGEMRPVVKDGQVTTATLMECTLSVDHRVIDGAVGAEFLKVYKHYISNPVLLVV